MVGIGELTVFAVKRCDLPPNAHALLGNPHLKQLHVSLDFAQNHPYCRLEEAMDYGRSLVFPTTLLVPTNPGIVETPARLDDPSRTSPWVFCCGLLVLLGLALAVVPQACFDLNTLALMIEPRALISMVIGLFLSRWVWPHTEAGITVLESLVGPRVGTRTVAPFPPPLVRRPDMIAPFLTYEERARLHAANAAVGPLFAHNATPQRKLGGKSPHGLVYGRTDPMHIHLDQTRRVSTTARTHSSKSRSPLKRRLKLFTARWSPSSTGQPSKQSRRQAARFALEAVNVFPSPDSSLGFRPRREPYGKHSVTIPDLLSQARSLASSQALSAFPARRCFAIRIVPNDRDEEGSSSVEPPSSALVPRQAWMRETPPFVTDEEADRVWDAGTTRLFGPRSFLEPSSFTGGNTLKATAELQRPSNGKHESRVAIDTQSDVTTCLREFLVDIHAIVPDIVEGCGGAANFTEEGTLYVYSHTERNSIALPALVALPHQLPSDCVALVC